jgi:uncharacterized protein YggT (Ycf19 family)
MAFERQAAQNNPSRFPNYFLLRLISGFMRPIRTKIPPFDSA